MKFITMTVIGFCLLFWGINQYQAKQEQNKYQYSDSPIQHRQEILQQFKILRAFETGDSVAYSELIKLPNNSMDDQNFKSLVSSTLHHNIDPLIPFKLPDTVLVQWSEAYVQQLRDARRNKACALITSPGHNKDIAQVQNAISESTQQKTILAITAVLKHKQASVPYDENFAKSQWSEISRDLRSEFGDDIWLLHDIAGENPKSCDVIIRSLEVMLSRPTLQQQSAALRLFFKQHDSLVIF